MTFFDKELVRRRFSSHLADYDKLSVVQRNICKRLADKLALHINSSDFNAGNGYEVGAGTGFLTRHTLSRYPNIKWYINDLVCETEPFIDKVIDEVNNNLNSGLNPEKINYNKLDVEYIWGDGEDLNEIDNISLFVSSSAMQWFNSIENYIITLSTKMVKGGYGALSTFGQQNFIEVKTASGGIGLNYPKIEDLVVWCEQSGFDVLMSDDYTEKIYFESPADVLSYIKQTGMNGNNSRKWTKSDFEHFCSQYETHFKDQTGIPLTFNPLQLIIRKR